MASTVTRPCSPMEPYSIPPRLIENASASRTYDWNAFAACRSNETDAQCGVSCLRPGEPALSTQLVQRLLRCTLNSSLQRVLAPLFYAHLPHHDESSNLGGR